jgi:uncharacterized membrane protein
MEYFKNNTARLINHTFQSLLVTYLLLLLVEQVWTGFVSNYFNLNYLLIIVIIAGILSVFSEKEHEHEKATTWKDYAYITVLSLAGLVIIKFKTVDLGWLSWVISIIAGILIYLLSILILEDEEEKEVEFHWNKNNKLIVAGSTLLVLVAITVALSFFTSIIDAARIVFGAVYVLFIPGFIISFVFFKKLDSLERIALSFALSIAIVPLVVFGLNLIVLKISTLSTFLTILGIIMVSTIILYFMRKNKE